MNGSTEELIRSLTPILDLASSEVPGVALTAARLMPIVWLAPIFGGRLLPVSARTTITIGLAMAFRPEALLLSWTSPAFLLALCTEVSIGVFIGVLAALPFEAARAGGSLIDVTRGASLARVSAPGLFDKTSPVGSLFYLGLLVLITSGGFGRLLITSLADCFVLLPTGGVHFWHLNGSATPILIEATSSLLVLALLLAAPALILALLSDIALGIVGRVTPQLPLFFLGLPLKTLLGLAVVAFALTPIFDSLVVMTLDLFSLISALFFEPRGI